MKCCKKLLSVVLILCLALPPIGASAAENNYGPDADGYAYTVSQTSFDLGTVKHDGSGLKKSDVFSYTVTNTGEKPIKVNTGGFGRYETMFQVSNYSFWIPLEPGESATLHYDMEVKALAPTRTDAGESWAQSYLYVELGDKVDSSIIISVDFKIVNTSETPEPEPTPTPAPSGGGYPSGYYDEYGRYWGTDSMGNRLLGVEVGGNGNYGSSSSGAGTVNLGENLSIREGESYGFTVSPHSLVFDSCFVGEEVEPQYVTLTNTGSTALDDIYSGFFVGNDYYSPISMRLVEGKLNSNGELEPGKSVTYELTLNTYREGSGTITYEGQFLLYSHIVEHFEYGISILNKAGHYGKIPGVLTVDYDIRPLSEVKTGDIDWDLEVRSIDFGVSDVSYMGYHKSQEKTFTVTNRGSFSFDLEVEVDASACKREDREAIFYAYSYDGYSVEPGESATVTVSVDSGQKTPGTVEGCVLKLTAYYPDSREKNTITTSIPLSIKYLYDGGYVVRNVSDNTYGTVKTSDGVDRSPYSGNDYFTVKEGSGVTFVMTPSDPDAYKVTDIKLGGRSVGISGLVDNTYTISNIRDNYEFEAVFGPIKTTPVGSTSPASWAAESVAQAIETGILPSELQSAYDQPITRREFCVLADMLWYQHFGSFPATHTVAFTDTNDPYVLDMASVEVIYGIGEGYFDPDGLMTREQAATILVRLADAINSAAGEEHVIPAGTVDFADNDSISPWALEFVGRLAASGVMRGMGDNQFSPKTAYTREQSVVTIMRLYELLG